MSTRISNATLVSELSRYMTENKSVVNEKYLQISSGNNYLRRSDDPVTTYEIANIEARNVRTDQWSANISKASSWETATESQLESIEECLQRLNELMVEANAGTYTEEDLKNIGIEVDQVLESLISSLNADFAGTPMFAGAGIRPTGHSGHWNESTMGTTPQSGDPGMPAVGGNDWDNLTETEYNTWHDTICVGTAGGITGSSSNSITCAGKDWSTVDLTGATVTITDGSGNEQTVTITSNTSDTLTFDSDLDGGIDLTTAKFEISDYAPSWISSTGSTFEATRDSDGDILTVTYNGSSNKRSIQVSDFKTTSSYGTTGEELVNFEHLEKNPSAPPDWITVDVNIFDSIIDLRDSLLNGEVPSETTQDRINAGLDNVISHVVQNSVSQNKLNLMSENVTISQQSGENWLADLNDVDIALAVTELNEMETSLQATYQMVSRMNGLRLIDYI